MTVKFFKSMKQKIIHIKKNERNKERENKKSNRQTDRQTDRKNKDTNT